MQLYTTYNVITFMVYFALYMYICEFVYIIYTSNAWVMYTKWMLFCSEQIQVYRNMDMMSKMLLCY